MALRAVPDHPKFAALKTLLRQPKGAALGWLEIIWHFCGRFTPQGNIGKYEDSAIEAWVEWDGEPGTLIYALVKSGWLDRSEEHRLVVHDWAEHADRATKAALKRANKQFCAHTVNICAPPPSSEGALPVPVPVPVPVPGPVPDPVPDPVLPRDEHPPENSDAKLAMVAKLHPKLSHLLETEIEGKILHTIIGAVDAERKFPGRPPMDEVDALRYVYTETRRVVETYRMVGREQFIRGPDDFWVRRKYRETNESILSGSGGRSGDGQRTTAAAAGAGHARSERNFAAARIAIQRELDAEEEESRHQSVPHEVM